MTHPQAAGEAGQAPSSASETPETASEYKRIVAELEQANAAMKRELHDLKLGHAIERRAAALHLFDPEVAAHLLDRTSLEFDDNGAPVNLDAALHALVKAKPWLSPQAQRQPGRQGR
jgi:hypothetical protein